jgi:hypothetical protein
MSQRRAALTSCAFTVLAVAALDAPAASPSKAQCVAANESAQDLRRDGRLHEARGHLATCLSTSCPRPVREDCAQRLADVEAAMPTAVFVVKDASGNDVGEVRVTVDGAPLAQTAAGEAVAMDPGEHRFAFEAPGFRATETTVVLREGEKKRRLMVSLEPISQASEPPATETAAPAVVSAAPSEAANGRPGAAMRTTGLVLGAAGVAAGIAGGIFGVLAKTTYDRSASECPAAPCSVQSSDDRKTAFGQATTSDVAFAAAGVLVAAGVVLYVTAPHGASKVGLRPSAFEHGWGASLGGTW